MRNRLLLTSATALALALPLAAEAGTTTTTIAVTATVPQACTVAATAMAFGNYDPTTGTNGTSTITVNCVASDSVTIDLDSGLHGTLSGAATTRNMQVGGTNLNYQLYSNAARTAVWATGTPNNVTGTANLQLISTVYGQIPASQTANPGAYTDTVTVTLTY